MSNIIDCRMASKFKVKLAVWTVYLVDVHRCTRVENPGEGVRDVFAKIPRGGGVKGFRKNCQGGSTYFAFYCIFINKFFKNLPGGVLFHTLSPSLPPLCASMTTVLNFISEFVFCIVQPCYGSMFYTLQLYSEFLLFCGRYINLRLINWLACVLIIYYLSTKFTCTNQIVTSYKINYRLLKHEFFLEKKYIFMFLYS